MDRALHDLANSDLVRGERGWRKSAVLDYLDRYPFAG